MKTAISISDEVFREADRLAGEMKLSRSQLYTRAIAEYLARHQPDSVRQALDDLQDELVAGSDDFLQVGLDVLRSVEW